MKILLSNKFYYRRGGDCVCTINLEELLKRKGHEVAIFAMQYPDNIETPWSKYFPGEVKFKPGLGMLEALLRPFGTNEVKRKFTALLMTFVLILFIWIIFILNYLRLLQKLRIKKE